MSQKDNEKVVTVVAYFGQSDKSKEISYTDTKVIGSGSFGIVFQARLCDTNDIVAVKKVLQDRRFKNRELQIMRQLEHPNIVLLKYFFHSVGERKEDVFLNLVLEYIPETVYRVARRYTRQKETVPILFVKLYMYQLMRSLAYIHHKGICHRDIKPQNLLLNPSTCVLKLCDFGSAKVLIRGEPNVSYICSRYYRAPELIFGAVEYSCQIDVWSSGCVLAELLLGQPIFPGDSGVDQLVEIIKVLGTPTKDQIHEMNPDYREFRFPQIKPHLWCKVFCPRVPVDAVNLVSRLLDYTPSKRLTPLETCLHPFFDDLRKEHSRLPNDQPLPPLFNLTAYELSSIDNIQKLITSKVKPATDPPQATQSDSHLSESPLVAGDGGPTTAPHSSDVSRQPPKLGDSNLNPVSTETPQSLVSTGGVGGEATTFDVMNKNNSNNYKLPASDETSECRTTHSVDGSSPKE